jgi:hypothetical protein
MRVHHRTTRPAFTLTEMLVATALCLFLMVVIGEAVGQATRTFSVLRTAGQLQERNRGAVTTIRRDLSTDRFAGPYLGGRGGPMVGMQRMDVAGWQPPPLGYFEVTQLRNDHLPAAVQSTHLPNGQVTMFEPSAANAVDSESLTSTRATTHYMRFTMRLPAAVPSELYAARIVETNNSRPTALGIVYTAGNEFVTGGPTNPDLIFYSRWAEVAYYLLPHGDTTAGPQVLQLYSLRRKLRILAPRTTVVGAMAQADVARFILANPDLALVPGQTSGGLQEVVFLGPDRVNDRVNRVLARPANPANPLPVDYQLEPRLLNYLTPEQNGSDILLTDVLSFEVKVAWGVNQALRPDYNPFGPPPTNILLPFLFESYLPNSSPFAPTMATTPVPNMDEPYSDLPETTGNPILQGVRTFDTGYRNEKNDRIDWDSPTTSSNGLGFLARPPVAPPVPNTDPGYGAYQAFLQSTHHVPLRVNVRSIQIKLRIWDAKAEQARQVTIVQEL